MLQVGMRESKAVRKSVVKAIKEMEAKHNDPMAVIKRGYAALEQLCAEKGQTITRKTYPFTMSQILKTNNSHKVKAVMDYLVQEGYVLPKLGSTGRHLGYTVMAKGEEFCNEVGGAGQYSGVRFTTDVLNIIPNELK